MVDWRKQFTARKEYWEMLVTMPLIFLLMLVRDMAHDAEWLPSGWKWRVLSYILFFAFYFLVVTSLQSLIKRRGWFKLRIITLSTTTDVWTLLSSREGRLIIAQCFSTGG